MSVTRDELVTWVKSKLGTPYVYGAKGAVLTQAQINTWASLYPSTFTSSYITKAKKFIGKNCTDCSGLISWKTGVLRGSSNYRSSASEEYAIAELDETMIGYGLWVSGHIGVYIGDGYCIEARGIDYGTVKTKVADRSFTKVIKLCDIDYGSKTVTGWLKEDGKWHFYESDGTMAINKWILSDAGYWYYFNGDGNLMTGWLQTGDFWYYCDESDNDDLIGKMLKNTVVRTGGVNYYVDGDGKMATSGNLTFTVSESGALVLVE